MNLNAKARTLLLRGLDLLLLDLIRKNADPRASEDDVADAANDVGYVRALRKVLEQEQS